MISTFLKQIKNFFTQITTKKAVLFISIIGILVFINALFNGFVGDDNSQLVKNVFIHSLNNAGSFFQGSTFYDGSRGLIGIYYRPMVLIFYTLVYEIQGLNPVIFHSAQLFIHILNAIFVFLLFKKFFEKKISLILAILFLVHPINEEVVVYIANLQDVLFFFFGISAVVLLLYRKNNFLTLLITGVLLLCSLFSKETGILFFPIIVLYYVLYSDWKFNLPKILIMEIIVFVTYVIFRFSIAKIYFTHLETAPLTLLPLATRVYTMPKIALYYFITFVFPKNLALAQLWVVNRPNFMEFYFPILIIITLLITVAWVIKRLYHYDYRLCITLILFTAWLILGIIFHLQILPLDATVADRWFYFSSIGFLGIIGTLWLYIHSVYGKKLNNKILTVLLLLIFVMLSFRTIKRNFDFHDDMTLLTHDIQVNPSSHTLNEALGMALISSGNYRDAGTYLKNAANLFPSYESNWSRLGTYYFTTGDLQAAKESYQKALSLDNDKQNYADAYASILFRQHQYGDVKQFATEAFQKHPNDDTLLLIIAMAEYKSGHKDSAIQYLQQAFDIKRSSVTVELYTRMVNNQDIDNSFVISPNYEKSQ